MYWQEEGSFHSRELNFGFLWGDVGGTSEASRRQETLSQGWFPIPVLYQSHLGNLLTSKGALPYSQGFRFSRPRVRTNHLYTLKSHSLFLRCSQDWKSIEFGFGKPAVTGRVFNLSLLLPPLMDFCENQIFLGESALLVLTSSSALAARLLRCLLEGNLSLILPGPLVGGGHLWDEWPHMRRNLEWENLVTWKQGQSQTPDFSGSFTFFQFCNMGPYGSQVSPGSEEEYRREERAVASRWDYQEMLLRTVIYNILLAIIPLSCLNRLVSLNCITKFPLFSSHCRPEEQPAWTYQRKGESVYLCFMKDKELRVQGGEEDLKKGTGWIIQIFSHVHRLWSQFFKNHTWLMAEASRALRDSVLRAEGCGDSQRWSWELVQGWTPVPMTRSRGAQYLLNG